MLTNNDIKKIIIIAALIIFWPQISDFLNPKKKEKKKEEKDMEIDDVSMPEPQVDEICKYIVYEPLSLVGLRGSSLLPKGYCLTGDSYFDDKPHSTGDPYADEQAEEYESIKKSEGITANLDSIAIILNNTTDVEITTDILDTTEENNTWVPLPDAPIAIDASDIELDSFYANWELSSGAIGYYLDVATDINFTSFVTGYENKDVGDVLTYNVTGLDAETNYYYRIRAYNNTGTGDNSNTITAETLTIYDDWFLPSKDELNAMYTNLHLEGVGNFSDTWYWASSEGNFEGAYVQYFDDGVQSFVNKFYTYAVRACRSFTAEVGAYSLQDIGPAGGLIFHIDGTTYYEAAPSDQSDSQVWSNIDDTEIGTTGTAIGTGKQNTLDIIGQVGHTDSAAKLCNDLEITN